ncbi:unnamed protein product [Ectocarpus sp. 12 AP-2014]
MSESSLDRCSHEKRKTMLSDNLLLPLRRTEKIIKAQMCAIVGDETDQVWQPLRECWHNLHVCSLLLKSALSLTHAHTLALLRALSLLLSHPSLLPHERKKTKTRPASMRLLCINLT